MKHPRHLWSGAWREESEEARLALDEHGEPLTAVTQVRDAPRPAGAPARPAVNGTHPADVPPPQRRGRLGRRAALIAVPAAAVAIAGYAIGVHSSDDPDTRSTQAERTLPAAQSSKPLTARAGSTRTGLIYGKASPAVVSIRNGAGSGTGFLVSDSSTVVTNAHVVNGASRVTVRFGARGRQLDGRVMGIDPSSDLAVVKLPAGAAPSGVKPLELADSDKVGVGDPVVAIGNPFGLDRTATEGIVSGLGREIQAPNGFSIEDAIQTDAPINPGNSGGPLLDSAAHVVGVNSQIETGGGSNGNVGIGFAVPSNTVRQAVPVLAAGRKIAHAWLGVESGPANASGGGAIVRRATAGGPAARAGISAGDQIVAIDGQAIAQLPDVSRIVNAKRPGDKVQIKVLRGSREETVSVTLGNRPQQVP
jgi:putative serine protease PepD